VAWQRSVHETHEPSRVSRWQVSHMKKGCHTNTSPTACLVQTPCSMHSWTQYSFVACARVQGMRDGSVTVRESRRRGGVEGCMCAFPRAHAACVCQTESWPLALLFLRSPVCTTPRPSLPSDSILARSNPACTILRVLLGCPLIADRVAKDIGAIISLMQMSARPREGGPPPSYSSPPPPALATGNSDCLPEIRAYRLRSEKVRA